MTLPLLRLAGFQFSVDDLSFCSRCSGLALARLRGRGGLGRGLGRSPLRLRLGELRAYSCATSPLGTLATLEVVVRRQQLTTFALGRELGLSRELNALLLARLGSGSGSGSDSG